MQNHRETEGQVGLFLPDTNLAHGILARAKENDAMRKICLGLVVASLFSIGYFVAFPREQGLITIFSTRPYANGTALVVGYCHGGVLGSWGYQLNYCDSNGIWYRYYLDHDAMFWRSVDLKTGSDGILEVWHGTKKIAAFENTNSVYNFLHTRAELPDASLQAIPGTISMETSED